MAGEELGARIEERDAERGRLEEGESLVENVSNTAESG
jgi:hypothetical protein